MMTDKHSIEDEIKELSDIRTKCISAALSFARDIESLIPRGDTAAAIGHLLACAETARKMASAAEERLPLHKRPL